MALLGNKRRGDFLELLPKGSVGAEVGVFRGHFTKHILERVRPSRLHLIDGWWRLYGEHFPNWGWYTRFGRLKTRDAYASVERTAARHDGGKSTVMHVGDAAECLRSFDDSYFDWVYIDSAHDYEHTKAVLEIVKNKVKPGGTILGHDWEENPCHVHHGVCKAVNDFMKERGWKLLKTDDFSQWCIAEVDVEK